MEVGFIDASDDQAVLMKITQRGRANPLQLSGLAACLEQHVHSLYTTAAGHWRDGPFLSPSRRVRPRCDCDGAARRAHREQACSGAVGLALGCCAGMLDVQPAGDGVPARKPAVTACPQLTLLGAAVGAARHADGVCARGKRSSSSCKAQQAPYPGGRGDSASGLAGWQRARLGGCQGLAAGREPSLVCCTQFRSSLGLRLRPPKRNQGNQRWHGVIKGLEPAAPCSRPTRTKWPHLLQHRRQWLKLVRSIGQAVLHRPSLSLSLAAAGRTSFNRPVRLLQWRIVLIGQRSAAEQVDRQEVSPTCLHGGGHDGWVGEPSRRAEAQAGQAAI